MSKLKDLTGQKFGRLTVIERAEKTDSSGNSYWKCKCDCNTEIIVSSCHLKNGHTRSCGCLNNEKRHERIKHGLRHTKIYTTWINIKDRCNNIHCPTFKHYGGRGIEICAEWQTDFQAFYNYVSTLEHFNEDGYSLDRINNNGNYEPDNVRWVNFKNQARNRRSNVFVKYEGKIMTLAEAAEKSGLNYGTLWDRYKRGDRGDKLFRPVKK